ncbi:MAG: hypothetical protein R6U78_13285 [Bacteroidales bacterium]
MMKHQDVTNIIRLAGRELITRRISRTLLLKLHPYLRSAYTIFEVVMFGRKLIMAIPKGTGGNPEMASKQMDRLRKVAGRKPVVVLDSINTLQRSGLKRKKLLPSAQFLLICHMVSRDPGLSLEDRPFREIALTTGATPAAVSRGAKDLEKFGLVDVFGGKEKRIRFRSGKEALWMETQVLNLMLDPVWKKFRVNELPPGIALFRSGVPAMDAYIDFETGDLPHYAAGRKVYNDLKKAGILKDQNEGQGRFTLEIWRYDPGTLAGAVREGHDTVDPFSLYLQLKNTSDLQIREALDRMIGGQLEMV